MSEFLVHFLTLTSPVSGRATTLAIARDCDKFTNVEGAGRYQYGFREREKLFWGAPINKFREPGEKGQISKGAGSRGPPLWGLISRPSDIP